MKGAWSRWVDHCHRPVDVRPLALLRVLMASCVVVDLLQIGRLGLVPHLYRPYEAGGMVSHQGIDWSMAALLGDAAAGPAMYGVTVVSFLMIALGVATRPAMVVGLIAYAQLGHCYPAGDRAVDRIVRTTILILLFSGAHRRFALGCRDIAATTAGWAQDLVKWLVVLIYLSAGVGKLGGDLGWYIPEPSAALYRIMTDPLAAWLDPVWWEPYQWLFQIGSWATLAVELTAPLVFTRYAPHWAFFAMWIHIGIAFTMKLGMFSYAMLAFYPVLFAPWWLPALDARKAARQQVQK